MESKDRLEQELDDLLNAYREACPDVEASPLFLPQLWQKIEEHESNTFVWRKLTRGFLTFAAAVSILFALLIFLPSQKGLPEGTSYVDTLADTQLAGVSAEPANSPVYVPREDRGQ